MASVIGRHHD